MGLMTVIKINAITVSADSGDELAKRFAARAGAIDNQDGFEGFELLRPTDERTTWLVVTRWRDDESFKAWTGPAAGRREQRAVVVRGRGRLRRRGICRLVAGDEGAGANTAERVWSRSHATQERAQVNTVADAL